MMTTQAGRLIDAVSAKECSPGRLKCCRRDSKAGHHCAIGRGLPAQPGEGEDQQAPRQTQQHRCAVEHHGRKPPHPVRLHHTHLPLSAPELTWCHACCSTPMLCLAAVTFCFLRKQRNAGMSFCHVWISLCKEEESKPSSRSVHNFEHRNTLVVAQSGDTLQFCLECVSCEHQCFPKCFRTVGGFV